MEPTLLWRYSVKRFLKVVVIGFALIGFLFSCLVVVVGGIYFKHAFFFKAQVVDDVYVVQRPFRFSYDLRAKKHNILIKEAGSDGWMIVDGYLYGSASSKPEYYVINLQSYNLHRFDSLWDLDIFLSERDLPDLDMSQQENISDLLYGRGRDRLYLLPTTLMP